MCEESGRAGGRGGGISLISGGEGDGLLLPAYPVGGAGGG